MVVALAAQTISPSELHEVSKIAAVCRAAADVAERSGNPMEGIRFVEATAEGGGLDREQRSILLTMCGVYFAGVTDTATDELHRKLQELDENTEELRKLLRQ